MELHQTLMQQIAEEQNRYRSMLLDSKEFSSLKSIKNNIKKMQRQLYTLQHQSGNNNSARK